MLYVRGILSIISGLLIGLILLSSIVHAQSYTINYAYLNIDTQSQSYTQVINITSNSLVIPIYQYCDGSTTMNISIYLDPLSSNGFSSIYLVLYNGTEITPILSEYSPKYVSLSVDCSLPVYGIELSLSAYPSLPIESLLIQGNELVYQLTSGSENITIPSAPGLNYAFSLVKVITILPGSFELSNFFTEPINETLETVSISSITTSAYVSTYITYLNTFQVMSNGTTYVEITPYYFVPLSSGTNVITYTGTAWVMLNGAPWINYTINNCDSANYGLPKLTPWTSYYMYTGQCSINYTISPITVEFTGLPSNTLCTNTVILIPNNNNVTGLSSNITLNPILNREFYIVISGTKYIQVILKSIPTNYVQIPLNLISRSDVQLVDENGLPVDAPLYVDLNGNFLLLTNNTCIYPGNYIAYAMVNNELVNLGNVSLDGNSVIKLPYFTNYEIYVTLPYQCPELKLQLNVGYNGLTTQYAFSGSSMLINLTNVLIGSKVTLQLIGNGTPLYLTSILINNTGYGNVVLSPRVISFKALDLLNEEIPYATLSIGNLNFLGPGDYCVPMGATVGFVSYGSDIYVVNITSNDITVKIWTISKLSINSLLTIIILAFLILIILLILRGFSSKGESPGDSDDYLIIRSINNKPT